ncbi:MAG: DNA topoisomerase III [Pseudomonadota bacterium]
MVNKITNIQQLYLCEKPSQGRDIARIVGANQRFDGYLQGNNIIVSWCIGHLLEMQTPDAYDKKYKRWSLTDLPILPGQWKMQAKKSTRKQLLVIKNLLKLCPLVIIATDADREGETIAREVLDYYNYKGQTQRLWLSALDTVSIKRALNSIKPSKETEPLYFSGLARGRADWLIGMNLTRAFTLLGKDRQVRSVGRVQTPTLALIVNRDKEILNFKAKSYYEVIAYFKSQSSELLETKWIFVGPTKQVKYNFDKQLAQQVIDRCYQQQGIVSTATTQRKKQPPPLLYNLSGLQQEASRRWGYGAQEVLNLAQSLYETHKLTSYPRSDCEYLPKSQFKDVSQILSALVKNDPSMGKFIAQANQQQYSRVWNDKKITAHHAIIPTQATPGISRLNNKELNIYNLIRRRYIAQFYPDYEYDQSTIVLTIKSDQFKASGRISIVRGWKDIIESPSTSKAISKKQAGHSQQLPAVKKGESLLCETLKLVDKLTQPPKFFTEGTLIKAMETIGTQVSNRVLKKILRETAGLGTQATRANIIQTLFQRKYIKKDKKLIKATALGFQLIDAVPETIKDPVLTAQWEQQLDDIASSKGDNSSQRVTDFIQQQINLLNGIVNQVKTGSLIVTRATTKVKTAPQSTPQYKTGDNCPECGNLLETRKAIRGNKIGLSYIGCTAFPGCRFYFWPLS